MATIAVPKRNYPSLIRNYTVLILILVMAGGYYSFLQYQKLSEARTALAKGQETLGNLQNNVSASSKEYLGLKKNADERFKGVLESLLKVFPNGENYTDLARLFDKFFQKNNSSDNPVFVSDLKFGISRVDPKKDYAILPVTLTISGTQNNFLKFLKSIEGSGELGDGSRLMEVRSISINFTTAPTDQVAVSAEGAKQPLLTVSVGLNAYFQKLDQKTLTN